MIAMTTKQPQFPLFLYITRKKLPISMLLKLEDVALALNTIKPCGRDILQILFMQKYKGTKGASQPYDKNTSFVMVDDEGKTLMTETKWKTVNGKRIPYEEPKRVKLRVNKEAWNKYKKYSRQVGATTCAIIRNFYSFYTQLHNGQEPTQELLRYFVDLIVKNKAIQFHTLTTKEQQQLKWMQGKTIIIKPVIRKKPKSKT